MCRRRNIQRFNVVLLLLIGCAYAIDECSRCKCCKGDRCSWFRDYSDYCIDGCIDGYYGIRCLHACNPACQTCSNAYSCTKCKDGYYGSYCNQCHRNCLICSDWNTCSKCKDGFYNGRLYDDNSYPLNSNCNNKCQENCKSCTSYHTCTECKEGFYNGKESTNSIVEYYDCRHRFCSTNCKSCTSYDTCTECIDGKYNLIYKNCIESCNLVCKSCTSYNTCTACPTGKYGSSCQYDCGLGCTDHQCDFRTGHCTCVSIHFQGDKCDECVIGMYGINCDKQCSIGCSGNICTRDGDCSSCKTGFMGAKCDRCVAGKYGQKCDLTCPAGCANNVCSNIGSCNSGCKHQFTGSNCETCIDGKFGNNCTQDCIENCKRCISRESCSLCSKRHYGNRCQPCPTNCETCSSETTCLTCDSGYYGHICSAKCPINCINGKCDKSNGLCICKNGFYGTNCDPCPGNCADCRTSDGSCITCSAGFYGSDCDQSCPSSCKFKTACQKSTGYCSECDDGFFKIYNTYYSVCSRCNTKCKSCVSNYDKCTACKDEKYGYNSVTHHYSCNKECPETCKYRRCNDYSGYCESGCKNGFWGTQCQNHCPENCKDGKCFSSNGTCAISCNEGYTGLQCKCPFNCNCNMHGTCMTCKSDFKNPSDNCSCTKRFCADEGCTSCSNSSFYQENEICCQCSRKCKQNTCDSLSKCTHGCVEGYRGDDCQGTCKDIDRKCLKCTSDYDFNAGGCLDCISGYHLNNIKRNCEACSEHCAQNACSSQNGVCMAGCIDGFWGEQCETSCMTYCLRCSQDGGTCSVCKSGKYLQDCSKECSDNCSATNGVKVCAISDGSCIEGCSSPSKYGKFCELKCNSNCINQSCDWKTGHCLNGCVDNFFGERCNQVCNTNCVTGNKGKRCNEVTGHCITKCIDGFYGEYCNKKCSTYCVNATCYKGSGKCLHGCQTGYTGERCAVAAEQTAQNEDDMGVTIGAAAGGGLFVIIVIVLILVVLLLRKRRRRDTSEKNDIAEINDNVDNTAVTYTEIRTTGLPVGQNDAEAVYSMPNKPKKNAERVKSMNDNTSTKTVNNPNYEKPKTNDSDPVKNQTDHKPSVTAKIPPVYGNAAVRSSATRSLALHKSMPHVDDTALEIEEDTDSMTTFSKTKSVTLANESNSTELDIADTYYNVTAVKKRKIMLDQLPDFVSKKTREDFIEEFKQLPPGLLKPYVDSQRRENLSKNRYKGIYPYDETRVQLKESDSDYINASYVDGYNKRKAYIASIGPTYRYMGDMSAFWIMIWQEKVGKIVMLTKLDEGGAPKCDQYWPEKDFSLMYANIQVTCQSEESYADYTVRSFTLQNKKKELQFQDSEKRKIVQVHFTAWPDKGTPDDVTSLIEFRQKVISTKTDLEGPILVHCSAGIGRTGTYIALDSLTEEGEAEGEVDIYAFVRNMREQRVNMVQTAEQYQYLHNALVHTLTFDSKAVEASKFDKCMTSHTDDHLGEKFEKLQASVEQRSDDEVDAVKRNQALRNKNRVGADIPGDRNRPKLYLERKLGSSDYINAVYVNSYTTINRYLVAQTPLPDTVIDFLTLLVQEKVSCIVSMETDSVDDKTIGAFYPADNQTLKKGTFTVKSKREKDTEQYVLRKLEIAHKGKSGTEDVTIPHIQFTHWNEHKNIPEEPAKFVQFVKDVEMKYGGNKPRGPILVHCLTGAEKSGLFCVVSNLLEKTQIDQETSVVNAVRQIKYRRHMSVPNKDQYIFCHQCVNEYLRTFDIYSNFELKT